MAAVTVKIGVEIGAAGNAQFKCCRERRETQRTLGNDMNNIGAIERPQTDQRLFGGQPHLEILGPRDRHALAQYFFEARLGSRIVLAALARPDQLNVVIAGAQALDHPVYGDRHAVDFGRIGLGYNCDTHAAVRGRQLLEDDLLTLHGHDGDSPTLKSGDS